MARPKGLEPPISRFVAAHSIQLSYGRISATFLKALKDNSTHKYKMQELFLKDLEKLFFSLRQPVVPLQQ